MARKKSAADKLIGGIISAPFAIASAVHKANVQERARQAKEAERAEKERLRAAKKAEAEQARLKRERERARKAAEVQRLRDEAERNRLAMANASLTDRYGLAIKRHNELVELLKACDDDETEKIIAYCKEDISIIPMLFDYLTRKSLIENSNCEMTIINTYYLLSRAYERMGQYDRAILACQQSLDMGLPTSGEGCSMTERIETLTKAKREVRSNGKM